MLPARFLARFTGDGAPDAAFNTAVGTTLNSIVYSVAVQSDGRVVVGGFFSAPSRFLARFTGDGAPDAAFNTAVGTTLDSIVYSVAVQSDGRVVVGGFFTAPSNRLARFFASTFPGAPVITGATAGDGSASVAFTAPGSDGGAAITDYQYRLDGAGAWVSTGSATSPVTISGLANGTPVGIQLRAVNAVGPGPASNTVTVTARTTPDAPVITGATAGDGSASVAFTAPGSDGGAAITDYQYRLNGAGGWVSAGSTTSPVTVTGLTNGAPVGIQLRAVNSVGPGPASDTVTTTPTAPPTPKPKTTLKVTAKPSAKRLTVGHPTTVVTRITSNGKKVVRAKCTVRGKKVNRVCRIRIPTTRAQVINGARVVVTPLCSDHVKVTVTVVAKKTGAPRKTWTRSWKTAKKPFIACTTRGTADTTRPRPGCRFRGS